MKKIRTCTAAVALALFPAAVSAQDAPDRQSTGFRVEGLVGYDRASLPSNGNRGGMLYGAGVGYDLGKGRIRFGVEAEASDSTAEACSQYSFALICSDMGRDLYVGARAGFQVDPRVLFYGKAGYTNIRQKTILALTGEDSPTSIRRESDGFRVGAGTEIGIGDRSFIKAEYRLSYYERSQLQDRHQAVIGFGFRF